MEISLETERLVLRPWRVVEATIQREMSIAVRDGGIVARGSQMRMSSPG